MYIKKCDRCGAPYEDNPEPTDIMGHKINSICLIKYTDHGVDFKKNIDLCLDCLESFKNWLL